MSAQTLLGVFVPPDGMVGHSAALVAMTGAEDFLEEAMQRFTGLKPRQRQELGTVWTILMLDGHLSPTRTEVFPPGRIPGLYEMQPRSGSPSSLLHAKVALLAFSATRTSEPSHLRLAVLTANFTYASARQQLELVWMLDAPLNNNVDPLSRADLAAAGDFVDRLLARNFYHPEAGVPPRERAITARFDSMLTAISNLAPANRKPRFFHSLERPLYEQIRERFQGAVDSRRNVLLCGSGFYELSARPQAGGFFQAGTTGRVHCERTPHRPRRPRRSWSGGSVGDVRRYRWLGGCSTSRCYPLEPTPPRKVRLRRVPAGWMSKQWLALPGLRKPFASRPPNARRNSRWQC